MSRARAFTLLVAAATILTCLGPAGSANAQSSVWQAHDGRPPANPPPPPVLPAHLRTDPTTTPAARPAPPAVTLQGSMNFWQGGVPNVPPAPPPNDFLGPPPLGGPIGPPPQPSGFFSAFELGLVYPEISGNLRSDVNVFGVPVPVTLPLAELDWTGSPRFELGYRFPDNAGSVVGAFRSVVSEGTAHLLGFDPTGPAFLRTRLDLTSIDIGYASPDIALAPEWDFRWDIGVRIGAVFYDSQATGNILTERVNNNFVGIGPRAGLGIRYHLIGLPGVSLFGRAEGAVLLGESDQAFGTAVHLPGFSFGGARDVSESHSVPVFGMQLGLTYAPARDPHWLRFSFGYLFEQWWDVGNAAGNSGDMRFQGLFFRGEFNY